MTDVDRTIASIGLPSHPTPPIIADRLRSLADDLTAAAKLLTNDGRRAIHAAEILAARGWPTTTTGSGAVAGGGTSMVVIDHDTPPEGERIPASSTELAATSHTRWDDVDQRLATHLHDTFNQARELWNTLGKTRSLLTDVLAHADDIDEIPAGTGNCEACDRFCNPKKNPDDRLRGGLCDACRKHYARSELERSEWLLVRRQMLGHTEGASALQQRFHQALGLGTEETPGQPEDA